MAWEWGLSAWVKVDRGGGNRAAWPKATRSYGRAELAIAELAAWLVSVSVVTVETAVFAAEGDVAMSSVQRRLEAWDRVPWIIDF